MELNYVKYIHIILEYNMLAPTLFYRNMRGLAGDLLLVSDGEYILEIKFCNDINIATDHFGDY